MRNRISAQRLSALVALFGFLLSYSVGSASGQQAGNFETRCGWFENPTPGNYSLYDKDGEWIFGVQGGYQTEDFEIPIFKRGQWIETNGSYGYGCACFQMKVDKGTSRVLEIKKSYTRPLAACRRDKALKKRWNFEL